MRGAVGCCPSRQTFTVKVEQLDLQQLLHLEQQKGIEGTGVLDGVIQLSSRRRVCRCKTVLLQARHAVVLRYQPALETAQERSPQRIRNCLWFCKRCLIFTTIHSNLGYSMRRTERRSSRQG